MGNGLNELIGDAKCSDFKRLCQPARTEGMMVRMRQAIGNSVGQIVI